MNDINPAMLYIARESCGLTQTDLAKKLGVVQGTISKYEEGAIQPSELILKSISEILDFPLYFFYQSNKDKKIDFAYYRKKVTIPKKIVTKAEALVNVVLVSISNLMEDVELNDVNLISWGEDTFISPESAAISLRRRWGIGAGRVDNIVKVVEDNGIVIIPIDFGSEKIDGLSYQLEDGRPVIFVNDQMSSDRQRLNIAHELGHVILHLGKSDHIGNRDIEKEAWDFASEFLVPKKDYLNMVSHINIDTLMELKRYWKISMGALLFKASKLNLITKEESDRLWRKMALLGYKKKEPIFLDVQNESPSLIREVIDVLKSELNYSITDIANNIFLSENKFKGIFLRNELLTKSKFKIIRNNL